MSIHMSVHMSIHVSIHRTIHMSTHMSMHMSIHRSMLLSMCVSICRRGRDLGMSKALTEKYGDDELTTEEFIDLVINKFGRKALP